MFKRLNLAKFNCESLTITLHAKLSSALAHRILTGSHHHATEGVPDLATYGSLYTVGKVRHAVQASVQRLKDAYHVEIKYMREDLPKPPKGWKSVQRLVTDLAEEPQTVTVECDAYLVYDNKSGWKSAIEIPVPVPSKKAEGPFTHIEAIRLSKRQQDNIEYWIQIRRGMAGELRHWVHIESEVSLSEELPGSLLGRSVQVSRLLLRKDQEGSRGS